MVEAIVAGLITKSPYLISAKAIMRDIEVVNQTAAGNVVRPSIGKRPSVIAPPTIGISVPKIRRRVCFFLRG